MRQARSMVCTKRLWSAVGAPPDPAESRARACSRSTATMGFFRFPNVRSTTLVKSSVRVVLMAVPPPQEAPGPCDGCGGERRERGDYLEARLPRLLFWAARRLARRVSQAL